MLRFGALISSREARQLSRLFCGLPPSSGRRCTDAMPGAAYDITPRWSPLALPATGAGPWLFGRNAVAFWTEAPGASRLRLPSCAHQAAPGTDTEVAALHVLRRRAPCLPQVRERVTPDRAAGS